MAEGEKYCYRTVFGCLEPVYHARFSTDSRAFTQHIVWAGALSADSVVAAPRAVARVITGASPSQSQTSTAVTGFDREAPLRGLRGGGTAGRTAALDPTADDAPSYGLPTAH